MEKSALILAAESNIIKVRAMGKNKNFDLKIIRIRYYNTKISGKHETVKTQST